MGYDHPGFGERVAVDHRAAIRLEIHPLRHVNTEQRISGRDIKGELQMEYIAVSLGPSFAHEARPGGSVVMRIQATDQPRPVLALALFKSQVLLEMENISLPMTFGPGREDLAWLATARLNDAQECVRPQKNSPGSNTGFPSLKLAVCLLSS